MTAPTLLTRHVPRLTGRLRLTSSISYTPIASRRWASKQTTQTFPIPPESHYASTLKNLNILSDAKTVVVGSSQKLDAISKLGTNIVGFIDESSSDLTGSIQNVLQDALPWVLYISTKEASPVLEALRHATKVQVPLVVCSTKNFGETEMNQLREILDQTSMTRLLGPGASVFAAPHSGLAVWDQAIDGVKAGTIGIIANGYDSIVEAVKATQNYGHSALFDLGTNGRAGTRPWEVAEWLFSDDGTEIMLVFGNGHSEMEAEVAAAYKEYAERTPDNQRRKRMVGIIDGAGRKSWEEAGILVASDISEAVSLIERETARIEEKREDVAQTTKQDPEKVSVTDLEP